MNTSPFVIENLNLSTAWIAALAKILDNGKTEISPLILTLTDFAELPDVRKALDNDLTKHSLPLIETVSETIFPVSLYEYSGFNRQELYRIYKKNLIEDKKNRQY